MKILSTEQVRSLDQYTIQHEPIRSIDLMERASAVVTDLLTERVNTHEQVMVFCGMGNNGGDGLAVARQLMERGYLHVSTFVVRHSPKASDDFSVNEERLKSISGLRYIETDFQIPLIPNHCVVVDAIFGSGLSRPVTGISAAVIQKINEADATIYSIDMPSGMYGDQVNAETDEVIAADLAYTFHCPKLTFLLPCSSRYLCDFEVLDIGLDKVCAETFPSPYHYLTPSFIRTILKTRNRFSHKGTYGHALMAAGSYGKVGAAVLSVKAALRSGAGLVSAYVPGCAYEILQNTAPEAMVITDAAANELSQAPDLSKFSAIGIGPGIGISAKAKAFLRGALEQTIKACVLDADALNILSENKEWLKQLPPNTVLTPHPGEFKRLVGEWRDDLDKLKLQSEFAARYQVVLVLKGAHTTIALPDGRIYFNATGNPGMAKGGSGDVLTGIITSLLAQGYSASKAAQIGVWVHGMAGDFAATYRSQIGMSASDIIRYLPKAFAVFE